MKKLDIWQITQLLGNLGIVAGILLLVYELNQNRAMMAAQTRNSIAQASAALIQNEATKPAYLEVMLRGMDGEELTRLEQAQFDLNWSAYFRLWENSFYQYRVGLYDDVEYKAEQKAWARLLSTPGIWRYWCSQRGRGNRSEIFIEEIDKLLEDAKCE